MTLRPLTARQSVGDTHEIDPGFQVADHTPIGCLVMWRIQRWSQIGEVGRVQPAKVVVTLWRIGTQEGRAGCDEGPFLVTDFDRMGVTLHAFPATEDSAD